MENGVNNSRMVNIFYDPKKLGQKGKNSGFVVTENGKKFPVMMGDGNYKTADDAVKTIKWFLDKGYSLENIRINGQPAEDIYKKKQTSENKPVRHLGDNFCKADFCEPKMFCAMKMPSSDQVIKGMSALVTITTLLNQLIDSIKDTAGKIPHKKNETNKPDTPKTETEKTEYSEAA